MGSTGINTSGSGPDSCAIAYLGVGVHTRGEEIVSSDLSEGWCG